LPFLPVSFLRYILARHHQQSPMRVEGIHTTGCCPVPRRDRLRHCYHHLSAMQSSARCLTPWLQWTIALFAVSGRYLSPRRGRLGLDFGRVASSCERGNESCGSMQRCNQYWNTHTRSLQILNSEVNSYLFH